jgi:hypothetical protein
MQPCKICGWRWRCGDPSTCITHVRNVNLYMLRYKREPKPEFVRSVRHQGEGPEEGGKGDSYEGFILVDAAGNEIGRPPILSPEYVLGNMPVDDGTPYDRAPGNTNTGSPAALHIAAKAPPQD